MESMTVHELITRLPAPHALLERCRAFAALDAVFEVEWRTYWFNPAWGRGIALAEMRNGLGDQYGIVFESAGVFLYGFDHDCLATPWRAPDRGHWPGLLDAVPAALSYWAEEPAFQFRKFFDATLCACWEPTTARWSCGPVEFPAGAWDPDGAQNLFGLLADGSAEAFTAYVRDYYQVLVDRDAVAHMLEGEPLTREVAAALNPNREFADLAREIAAMGFAVAPTSAG